MSLHSQWKVIIKEKNFLSPQSKIKFYALNPHETKDSHTGKQTAILPCLKGSLQTSSRETRSQMSTTGPTSCLFEHFMHIGTPQCFSVTFTSDKPLPKSRDGNEIFLKSTENTMALPALYIKKIKFLQIKLRMKPSDSKPL